VERRNFGEAGEGGDEEKRKKIKRVERDDEAFDPQ